MDYSSPIEKSVEVQVTVHRPEGAESRNPTNQTNAEIQSTVNSSSTINRIQFRFRFSPIVARDLDVDEMEIRLDGSALAPHHIDVHWLVTIELK